MLLLLLACFSQAQNEDEEIAEAITG